MTYLIHEVKKRWRHFALAAAATATEHLIGVVGKIARHSGHLKKARERATSEEINRHDGLF